MRKYEAQSSDVKIVCKKVVNDATYNLSRVTKLSRNETKAMNVKVRHNIKYESKTIEM